MRNRTLIAGMSTVLFFLGASQAFAESLTSTQTASLKQFGAEQSKVYTSMTTCSSDIAVNNKAFPNYLRTKCFTLGDTFSYYLYTDSNKTAVESAIGGSAAWGTTGTNETVDSGSYIAELRTRIGSQNLANIEKVLTNLRAKQETKTKDEYIKYIDNLLSKLTTLKSKYSSSQKVADIIDYLKVGIIKIKLEFMKDSDEESFWEELSGNNTSESSENGGSNGSTTGSLNVPAVTLSVYAGILNGSPKLLTNNDTTFLWTPADPNELNVTFASTNASTCTFDGKLFPLKQVSGTQLYKNLPVGSSHTVQCINSAWKSGDPENGTTSKSIRFTIKAPTDTPKFNFTTANYSVPAGSTVKLNWYQISNATSCVAGGDWSGVKNINGLTTGGDAGGSENVTVSSTKTYTLTCTGPTGVSTAKSITVGVQSATPNPATPTITVTVNGSNSPITVGQGANLDFAWTSNVAVNGCRAGAGFANDTTIGESGTSGSISRQIAASPQISITRGYDYNISCSFEGRLLWWSARVNVTPPAVVAPPVVQTPVVPVINLTSDKNDVRSGETIVFSYDTTGNTECSLRHLSDQNRSQFSTPISRTQPKGTYSWVAYWTSGILLQCAGGYSGIAVKVDGKASTFEFGGAEGIKVYTPPAPIAADTSMSLTADKTSVKKGDSVNLAYKIWSSFNKCIIFQSNVNGQGGGLTPANALYDTANGTTASQSDREGTHTITIDSFDKVQLACAQPGVSGYMTKNIVFTITSYKPIDGLTWDGAGPTLLEINRIYLELFNREGDAGGLRYWDSTNLSVATVRASFLNSGECGALASCKALRP